MQLECVFGDLDSRAFDVLLLGLFKNAKAPGDMADGPLKEFCRSFLQSQKFSGDWGERQVVHTLGQLPTSRLCLVGLGEEERYDVRRLRQAVSGAVRLLNASDVSHLAVVLESFHVPALAADVVARTVVEGVQFGAYEYTKFKQKEKETVARLEKLTLVGHSQKEKERIEHAAQMGQIAAEGVSFARDLQNHPGNFLTPTRLAEIAVQAADEVGLSVRVLEQPDIEAEKMGALLGVARGTKEPPRFIVLEYNAGRADMPTVVLVGKGVTFDSGGISIKPSDKMDEMKFDMSGAAAVLATLRAVAQLGLPLHVVGLVPAVENLPGGASMKPGDILTASSGTTIEVVNTDAEGRLILADALTYARRFDPDAVIDLATLTGACVVALGHHATGLLGNDQALVARLQQAGEKCGERLWPLPLWPDYEEDIKGDYADIKNSAGRPGGAITAAAFLGQFTKDYAWAHLDIAGTAWTDKRTDYGCKGGTGVGVRLLLQVLQEWG